MMPSQPPVRRVDHGVWDVMASRRVALLGDSTLDNLIWNEGYEGIPEQLKGVLGANSAVLNLAADGFTTDHVLRGHPHVISGGVRAEVGDAVPYCGDGVFRPLKQLASVSPTPSHTVLSVGGNDVRHILGAMHRLPEVTAALVENYLAIIEDVVGGGGPRGALILMLQYRPSIDQDGHYGVYRALGALPGPGSPMEKMNALMARVYAPVLAAARAHGFPVIDLPNSFDPANPALYSYQIEPSRTGGGVIAQLIAHVIHAHDPLRGSLLYSAQTTAVTEGTPARLEIVATPSSPQWSVGAA